MDYEPIALIGGGVLLVLGVAFALFLGISSSRLEARRHRETHEGH